MIEVAGLLVALATLITAIGGFIVAIAKINEVHETTNSKMEQFISEVREASFAAGQKDEKDRTSDT